MKRNLNKTIAALCVGALLGTTFLVPVIGFAEEGGTWLKGGAQTNNVSSGTAAAQTGIGLASATWGLLMNTGSTIGTFVPQWFNGAVCTWATIIPVCRAMKMGGTTGFGWNIDPLGIALDALLLYDAMNKDATWNEDIPELQAAVRQIGSKADLMGECAGEGEETCNESNETLDGTEVHIQALKNVGLESLEEVAGSVLITEGELIGAAPVIQQGFGSEVEGGSGTAGSTMQIPGQLEKYSYYIHDYGEDPVSTATQGTTVKKERTEAEVKEIDDRKLAHLQLTGTAGVARADIGATVARSEQEALQRLNSYVGSGDGLIANTMVLAGLDLTLSQRLNLLNMMQGQQVANEAAGALQFVETK